MVEKVGKTEIRFIGLQERDRYAVCKRLFANKKHILKGGVKWKSN